MGEKLRRKLLKMKLEKEMENAFDARGMHKRKLIAAALKDTVNTDAG